LIATLPGSSAIVLVRPPLFASAPRLSGEAAASVRLPVVVPVMVRPVVLPMML